MRRRPAILAAALAAAALAIAPAAASATFHLMSVREVYPGSGASPEAEYVELQMYATGQNLVAGHSIDFLDAAGTQVGTASFGADAPNGANQSTLVAATPAAESQFGVAADAGMPAGLLDPTGGAVCWESLDCVSWGGFHGSALSPTGSPADPLGIPDGMALRRTIAPGCPTLLEATDDRDDSAADFSDAFPAPRPNSVAPSERACSSQSPAAPGNPAPGHLTPGAGGGAGSGGVARRRPQTRIRQRPRRVTRDRTPTFRFTSSRRRSRFLCKLDRRRFRRCRSPFTARRLRLGRHLFRVKARAPGGATDRTPATWRFRVVRRLNGARHAAHRTRISRAGGP
ncbi:MAG TPA: hypothetical protein VFG58_05490 [Solirubrobacterales bacterium]|nr:hypothetical protein [Solirubrobacterales bacterium]